MIIYLSIFVLAKLNMLFHFVVLQICVALSPFSWAAQLMHVDSASDNSRFDT